MIKRIAAAALILFAVTIYGQNESGMSQQKSNIGLLQPISVTVGGDFIITGSFPAYSTQRLDQFITQLFIQGQKQILGNITQLDVIEKISKEISEYPLRDITLKRMNGSVLKIDLVKFRLTGDFKYNPYLNNDDVIIFPAYDPKTNFVDVSGAVNNPVKFQFVDGDKLSDALLFAGGINKAYDNVTQAQIYRLTEKGTKENIVTVNINDDFTLQRGDRIKVLYDENNKKIFRALVLGEVENPGFVFLKKDGNTLAEVVERARGFTSKVSLKDARLLRNSSPEDIIEKNEILRNFMKMPNTPEFEMMNMRNNEARDRLSMMRLSNLTIEDTTFFYIDNQLRTLKNEKYIDFTKLSDPQSDESKFVIRDGDVILFPEKFDYVYVFGQVARAGYVPFEAGKDFRYYISKAGGLSETARNGDETVIIKGQTRNWITENKEKVEIEPGDFIYVPKDIPRTFNFYLSRVSSIFGVIGSIATIVLLLVQFGK